MRRSETLSIKIKTSFDKAWDFISNPENLHLWTVDFALEPPEKNGDIYNVKTPRGMIELFVKACREDGRIDFYFGMEGDFESSSSRLIALNASGEIAYYFTQYEPKNAPPGLFEKLVSNVKREVEILKEILESR
jgi:hypothetical protein